LGIADAKTAAGSRKRQLTKVKTDWVNSQSVQRLGVMFMPAHAGKHDMDADEQSEYGLGTVDLADKDQVARACRKLRCTELQLEAAIRMVGPAMRSIEQWIRWQRLV